MKTAALLAAAVFALAAPPKAFRFSRPIEARPGWMRLDLPDDVLDACRAGLPDLRVVDQAGEEVPFAFEQDLAATSRRLPVENLESTDKTDTLGEIDRGPNAGFADAVTFEIAGADFLKPVRLESSDDRAAWKDAAKGSIFATADARMLTLRLPANDRRYLRFRFDDRNGPAVRPEAVLVHARVDDAQGPPLERPLTLSSIASDRDGVSRYAAALPAANLAVTALRFQAQDPAFSRAVRVYERVFFRDEVVRRLVAEGRLARAPGNDGNIDLPIAEPSGRNLEIEIENGDSPALKGLRVGALSRGRTLRFLVPETAGLRLLYGSPIARAPRYDLARSFGAGTPAATGEATLGVSTTSDAIVPPVSAPARVPLIDPEKWTSRRPIQLPPSGGVAFLDFYDLERGLADIRIVDAMNRQIPFVVEQGSHEHRHEVRLEPTNTGTRTTARILDLENADALNAIEIAASGPDYFSREVSVVEERRDGRGVTEARTLGTARWERKPDERAPVLRIPIARPVDVRDPLSIEIENGENVPITLTHGWALTSAVRIDFMFNAGEPLYVLSGNREASSPAYDLDMLASTVLSLPANAAGLGPAAEMAPPKAPLAAWFWVAIGVTVSLLVFELARTLKRGA
ncbi:MAG TPA: hypothetical protein VN032_01415 [Thermoanaerobaculia bacterium]|nr:hypothetical protein [Thermoanaerobaculia bacterium]